MVELKEIRKYFSSNGITALDGANFNLNEGEIHALLGENGAGKSTLMHIMSGFMKPGGESISSFSDDCGTILIDGKEQNFASPRHALAAGIGMVRQHPHHISGFLVWENCITGSMKHPPLWLNRRYLRSKVSELNERFRFDLPLDRPVETLSVSQGQKAAVMTLLLRNVQYLIFDEPAAVLSPTETEKLFGLLATLRDEGKGIVLISHKLEELLKIADRVTVLRQGKTQICCKASGLSNEKLYNLIFGDASNSYMDSQSIDTTSGTPLSRAAGTENKKPALTLRNFTVNVPGHPLIRGINLNLKQGKILGIAGVQDSGLETLEMALTGFLPFSGTLRINGTALAGTGKRTAKRIRQFRSAGGTYLGKRNEGETIPIRDLLIIHAHRRFQKLGILNHTKIDTWIKSIMDAANVPYRGGAGADAFSGGQLQRLLLTREMAEHGKLLVLSKPSRELDHRYRKRLAFLLREKAGEGTSVVIFSTDIDELLLLSDSIAVLRNGFISSLVDLEKEREHAQLKIRKAMVGQT